LVLSFGLLPFTVISIPSICVRCVKQILNNLKRFGQKQFIFDLTVNKLSIFCTNKGFFTQKQGYTYNPAVYIIHN